MAKITKYQYTIFNEAWYADAARNGRHTDEIMFGLYAVDADGNSEGCIGEMAMRWYQLGNIRSPRLEVYNDAWAVLAGLPALIAHLAAHDNQDITPEQFAVILDRCGFEDRTQRTRPDDE